MENKEHLLKILELVESGKITPEEAEELITALREAESWTTGEDEAHDDRLAAEVEANEAEYDRLAAEAEKHEAEYDRVAEEAEKKAAQAKQAAEQARQSARGAQDLAGLFRSVYSGDCPDCPHCRDLAKRFRVPCRMR